VDKGPWHLEYSTGAVAQLLGVSSDDFAADVMLRVSGDFATPAVKAFYCMWLVRVLNAASARVLHDEQQGNPESD